MKAWISDETYIQARVLCLGNKAFGSCLIFGHVIWHRFEATLNKIATFTFEIYHSVPLKNLNATKELFTVLTWIMQPSAAFSTNPSILFIAMCLGIWPIWLKVHWKRSRAQIMLSWFHETWVTEINIRTKFRGAEYFDIGIIGLAAKKKIHVLLNPDLASG